MPAILFCTPKSSSCVQQQSKEKSYGILDMDTLTREPSTPTEAPLSLLHVWEIHVSPIWHHKKTWRLRNCQVCEQAHVQERILPQKSFSQLMRGSPTKWGVSSERWWPMYRNVLSFAPNALLACINTRSLTSCECVHFAVTRSFWPGKRILLNVQTRSFYTWHLNGTLVSNYKIPAPEATPTIN